MQDSERQQLHDEIVAGRKVADLSIEQLKGLRVGWLGADNDYAPSFDFFFMIGREIERKEALEVINKRAEVARIAAAYKARRTAKFKEGFYK